MKPRGPPHAYFVGSAVFHYLGPAFAVLLFARVDVLGVAWLRIAAAAAVFALGAGRGGRTPACPRPRDARPRLGRRARVMNACFYLAIDRLPLGTVAAIEFLPVIALAALGARTPRNGLALVLAVGGVYLLTDVRLEGEPLGVAFALANAVSSRSTSSSATASHAAARRAASTRSERRCSSRWSSRRRWRAGPPCPHSPTRPRSPRESASASPRR